VAIVGFLFKRYSLAEAVHEMISNSFYHPLTSFDGEHGAVAEPVKLGTGLQQ
jgi:hypothetical protein